MEDEKSSNHGGQEDCDWIRFDDYRQIPQAQVTRPDLGWLVGFRGVPHNKKLNRRCFDARGGGHANALFTARRGWLVDGAHRLFSADADR